MSRPPGRVSGLVPFAAALACTAAVILWLLNHDDGGKLFVGYLASPVAMLAAAAACHRIGAQVVVPRPVRGFWKRMAQASVCLAIAGVVAGVTTGLGEEPGISPYTAAPVLVGMVLAMLAFLHLPLGRRTALNWVQVLLDGITVAVAGALVFFYVVMDFAVPGTSPNAMAAAAATGVGGLVAMVVVGKAAVAPAGPVDSVALRILTAGPLLATAGSVLVITADGVARLVLVVILLPVGAVVMSLSAYRQMLVLRREPRPEPAGRSRSAFNFLPFVFVAATAGLVLMVSAQELTWRHRMLIIGAVVIAGLVVLRQLIGLRENLLLLTENRRKQAELEQVARHDPLTGLANRTAFGRTLAERLAAHLPAAVLLIDVDDFKMVNDSMGHAVGDQLLHEVAQRLQRYSRAEHDLPARLGGDEFAVLLDMDDAEYAERAATRVLEALAAPFAVGRHDLLVQASVGVALAGPGDSADEVLRNADIAMYAAKAAGKASWTRFEPRMRQDVVNHARLGSDLHNALVRDELFLLYQPVFDLTTGRISGAEALVRWK
ncbi:diguanylate cyclase, partial [Actinoplanes sp. NPDC051633]|uniref:diguanylate cyclase domain-containing protein n=1 Tax=Actinoplanes sp. NPDC051633 TaxID=3155670 RepID=UPI0034388989